MRELKYCVETVSQYFSICSLILMLYNFINFWTYYIYYFSLFDIFLILSWGRVYFYFIMDGTISYYNKLDN